MYKTCSHCIERLMDTGLASELYFLICKHYIKDGIVIVLYEPAFNECLRYLEYHGFIVTTEIDEKLITAKPVLESLKADLEKKHCSGYCQHVSVDFKSG